MACVHDLYLAVEKPGQDGDDVFHGVLRVDNVDLVLAAIACKLLCRRESFFCAHLKAEARKALAAHGFRKLAGNIVGQMACLALRGQNVHKVQNVFLGSCFSCIIY